MQDFTHEDFNHVTEASHRAPVVVMFHASWCAPCQAMKPIINALAAEQGFMLAGIDAGENRALAGLYGVRSVPAVLVLKDDAIVGAPALGAKSIDQLRSYLAAAGVPA